MGRAARQLPPAMTVDEFLEWGGDGTATRFDLVDGQLRAQDAASDAHGTIQANIAREVGWHLKSAGSRCRVVTGVRPKLRADWNYRIPDVLVTCAPSVRGARDVPEPIILFEVLSPSNSEDTWDNVRNYTTIPSVRQIVIVSSSRAEAQVLLRDAQGHWPDNPTVIQTGAVPLARIDFSLAVDDIYWNTYVVDGDV
jgi:Uma2 family endonuclease